MERLTPPGKGRRELERRVGEFVVRGLKVVLYGTRDIELQGPVLPGVPGRPTHDTKTGAIDSRIKAVYGALAPDFDSPIWHAAVLPHAPPGSYTAGRRSDPDGFGGEYFTFMIDQELARKIEEATPVGGVYLLDGTGFIPSPYNKIDVISENHVPLLDPDPTLVTYHDLSFNLRDLPPVRIMRD